MTSELLVSFPDASPAQANIWARELCEAVSAVDRNVSAEQRRDDPDTLDFGTTLALVLAAPATAAFAKGLGEALARAIVDWLAARTSAKVSIARADGSTVIENISADDAVALARELSKETGVRNQA